MWSGGLRPFCLGLNVLAGSSLVQVMAWRLFGAITRNQLDPLEQHRVKIKSKYKYFLSRKKTHFIPASICQSHIHVTIRDVLLRKRGNNSKNKLLGRTGSSDRWIQLNLRNQFWIGNSHGPQIEPWIRHKTAINASTMIYLYPYLSWPVWGTRNNMVTRSWHDDFLQCICTAIIGMYSTYAIISVMQFYAYNAVERDTSQFINHSGS